jgi:signal transduction histidine kinase
MSTPSSRVLVVDDDPVVRDLAALILRTGGLTVDLAASGAEGLAALARERFDLVLLDVLLPDANGIDLARRVRGDPKTADMAILCVTAFDDSPHRVAALEAGADDFIAKPFTRVELLTRVRILLERRAAQRALEARLERIRELEAARDDLVHMMVHDMGNVLAGAMGYIELALGASGDPEELLRDLDAARDCVRALQRMFYDLLDLRRLEVGRMPIERVAFSAADAIHEAVDALAGIAQARRKSLRAEVPNGLPPLDADRGLVARVIVNLAMNAIKHAPKGTEVVIGAAPAPGDRIAIYVDDDGPGIAPEVRARLFEKFATASPEGGPSSERGRGLGLAFCKAAVEAHGGSISVFAREPRGTRFRVELPAAAERGAVANRT